MFFTVVPLALLGFISYRFFKVGEKAKNVATVYKISRSRGSTIFGAVASTVLTVCALCFFSSKKDNSDNVEENSDGTLTVSYKYKGNEYKFVVKKGGGPSKIFDVRNGNGDVIRKKIEPFMGPNEDFHGHSFSPLSFEEDEILFETMFGERKIFRGDEQIVI